VTADSALSSGCRNRRNRRTGAPPPLPVLLLLLLFPLLLATLAAADKGTASLSGPEFCLEGGEYVFAVGLPPPLPPLLPPSVPRQPNQPKTAWLLPPFQLTKHIKNPQAETRPPCSCATGPRTRP